MLFMSIDVLKAFIKLNGNFKYYSDLLLFKTLTLLTRCKKNHSYNGLPTII